MSGAVAEDFVSEEVQYRRRIQVKVRFPMQLCMTCTANTSQPLTPTHLFFVEPVFIFTLLRSRLMLVPEALSNSSDLPEIFRRLQPDMRFSS